MVASSASFLSGVCNIVTTKLDDNNFPTWHFQMQSLLRGHGLLRFVDGTLPCPSQYVLGEDGRLSPSADYEAWLEQDSTLISLLIATLSSEALAQVVGCSSAMEVWTTLKERYATVSRSNVVQLKSNLQSIEKGSDNIEKYLLRVKTARDQLAAIGVQISDEDIMILILKGLPSVFSTVRFMIKAKTTSITMAELRSLLLAAESELDFESKSLPFGSISAMVAKNVPQDSKGLLPTPSDGYTGYVASHVPRTGNSRAYAPQSGGDGHFRPRNGWAGNNGGFHHSNSGNYGTNGGSRSYNNYGNRSYNSFHGGSFDNSRYSGRPRIFCQICGKPGHSAQTCWHLTKNSSHGASSSTIECQLCGNPGHTATDCAQRQQFSDLQTTHTAMTASVQSPPTQEVWITDSGASAHMTADINSLRDVTSYPDGDHVQVGNGAGQGDRHGVVSRTQ